MVVGVVSVLALNAFLVDRLDTQLAAAGGRIQNGAPPGGAPTDSGGSGSPGLLRPGQAERALDALLRSGTVSSAGVVTGAGSSTGLTGTQQAVLLALPRDGAGGTRDLGGHLGRYWLRATAGGPATPWSPVCRWPGCGTP